MAAADAGARGITHLFNAMSQLQHRAPGVVGAALDHGGLWCGIIADGHHVASGGARGPRCARKRGRRGSFSSPTPCRRPATRRHLHLNGRKVTRRDGLLTLEDGTLAGLGPDDGRGRPLRRRASRRRDLPKRCAWRASIRRSFCRLTHRRGRIAPGISRRPRPSRRPARGQRRVDRRRADRVVWHQPSARMTRRYGAGRGLRPVIFGRAQRPAHEDANHCARPWRCGPARRRRNATRARRCRQGFSLHCGW